MYNFFLNLMNNPYAWLLLSLITILSIFLSVYFGVKSVPKKQLSATYKSIDIISKHISEIDAIKIMHNGKPLQSLSRTQYGLWNSGNSTISPEDFASTCNLHIVSEDPECQILNCWIQAVTSKANNVSCFLSDNTINISFEYLDMRDGLLIDILHTGNPDSIIPKAIIKGGTHIKHIPPCSDCAKKLFLFYWPLHFIVWYFTSLVAIFIMKFSPDFPDRAGILIHESVQIALVVVFFIILFVYAIYSVKKIPPRPIRP